MNVITKSNQHKIDGLKAQMISLRESDANKRFLKIAGVLMEEGYLLGPKIGSGSFSKVRVVERITDGQDLAVKIIDTDKAPTDYVQVFMPRELEILRSIKHEHIAYVSDIFTKDNFVFFVMDYAEMGDLLEYMLNNGAPEERVASRLFQQIVSAVHYLHRVGVAHRDLKCENILLKKNGDVLLTDFGFSRKLDQGGRLNKTFCGSACYASPQLIMAMPYDPRQNDAWGLGCILFILVCGSMPYDDTNITRLVQRQHEEVTYPAKVKDKLNPDVKTLIQRILEADPKKRYTTADIMNDTWYNST